MTPDDTPASDNVDPRHATSPMDSSAPAGTAAGEAVGVGVAPSDRVRPAWRLWLKGIVVAVPLAAAAAYGVWLIQRPVYTATAILLVATGDRRLVFTTAKNSPQSPEQFDTFKRTQRQWMRTRFVLMKALRDASLSKLPVLRGKPDPVEWLENNLSVTFPDESEVMYVSLSAREPHGLHELVNAVVSAYFTEVVVVDRLRGLEHLEHLEGAYRKAETELRTRRSDLQQLVAKVGYEDSSVVSVERQNLQQQIDVLNQGYAQARLELLLLQTELDFREAGAGGKNDGGDVSDRQLTLAMRQDALATQLNREKQLIVEHQESRRAQLSGEAADPQAEEFNRRLANLEQRIQARQESLRQDLVEQSQERAAAAVGQLKQKVELQGMQQRRLEQVMRELMQEANSIRTVSIDVDMMRSEILVLEDVVTRLSTEFERARVEAQSSADEKSSRVKLVSPAQLPGPVDESFLWPTTIGAAGGTMLLTMIVIFWLDARKRR